MIFSHFRLQKLISCDFTFEFYYFLDSFDKTIQATPKALKNTVMHCYTGSTLFRYVIHLTLTHAGTFCDIT